MPHAVQYASNKLNNIVIFLLLQFVDAIIDHRNKFLAINEISGNEYCRLLMLLQNSN